MSARFPPDRRARPLTRPLAALAALLGFTGGCANAAPADACRSLLFEEVPFTVCTAEPGAHHVALALTGPDDLPLRDFAPFADALGPERLSRLAFAMNAGMYHPGGGPVGLYVEDGRTRHRLVTRGGRGNFFLRPNGVFWGDADGWHVAATEAFAAARPQGVRFATQSGPMLVIDGALHPAFMPDGRSRHLRNGVGITRDGSALFAISDAPVSLGRFARLFRDALGCRNALYFDGSVSRLWNPVAERRDEGARIGPIVYVLRDTAD